MLKTAWSIGWTTDQFWESTHYEFDLAVGLFLEQSKTPEHIMISEDEYKFSVRQHPNYKGIIQ